MNNPSDKVCEQAVASEGNECQEARPYQPGVSYREPLPVIELSFMMSDMYIGSQAGGSEEDEPPMLKPRGEMFEQLETQITKLSSTFQTLQAEVQMLKNDFDLRRHPNLLST